MASSTPLSGSSSAAHDLALFLVRLGCGLPFLYHGSAILFGVFSGPGPVKFAAFLHYSAIVGYLVGLAQFAGGIAILTGALIRVGTLCTSLVMLGAIFIVHISHGYSIANNGMEFALTELLLSLSLLFTGAGKYSLGRILPGSLQKL
ncbi:MAG TPA: DoxX family protein [Candidatus Methylomirabilis sp.]|nr:DoxX family protein [Candidatus Methylomirabilis sp.]